MTHFEETPSEELSVAERERRLWRASEKYMQGELDVAEFEEIERAYMGDFGRAALGLAKQANRRRMLISSAVLTACLTAFVTSLIFFVTKSSWILIAVSAIIAAIAGPILALLLDNDEQSKWRYWLWWRKG